MSEPLEATGGEIGGAGTPTGERVIVRFDGAVLEVFHETGTFRYHAALIDKIGIEPSPAPTAEHFAVVATRQGCQIPVRFEGAERAELDRIVCAVRAYTKG